jgi:hypothetical protein
MQALAFWKAVVEDKADFLESLVALLEEHGIRYCVVGGVAVNAYVAPVVTEDLDLVVAADQLATIEGLLDQRFTVQRFPYTLNVSTAGSNLRVQVQTDPRFAGFVERAAPRAVLGLTLPVAALEDLLPSKIWAALEPGRRTSKRLKDLADIARLLEAYPELRAGVPPEILERLR